MKKIKFSTTILPIFMAFSLILPNTVVSGKSLNQLQKEQKNLQNDTKEARDALEATRNNMSAVEKEIDDIDQKLNEAQNQLNKVEADLEDASNRLEESQQRLAQAIEDKENQFIAFSKRVKFIYENSTVGYLQLIFNAESFNDFLTRMQYVNDIMNYDENLLTKLKEAEAEIKTRTEEIAQEKAQIEVLVAEQRAKTESLQALRSEKETLFASYMQDEEKYNQIIASNEKASREVERLIRQAQAEAAAATAINGSSSSSSSSASTYVYTGGQLNWPVPSRAASSSSLSSGFVNRKKPIGSGYEKHTGYDIPASYGSNIVAAEAGTVITAGWVNGYGNTVIISHGNGLTTLYGHNSSLVVSKGQTVSRGQVIAKCGSTGNSTGNHCHFEVRANGTAVSPEPYLGVANISR